MRIIRRTRQMLSSRKQVLNADCVSPLANRLASDVARADGEHRAVRVERRVDCELALAQGPSPGTTIVAGPPENLSDGDAVRTTTEGS